MPETITSSGTSMFTGSRPVCRKIDNTLEIKKNGPMTMLSLSTPPLTTNTNSPTIPNASVQIQSMFGAIPSADNSRPTPTVMITKARISGPLVGAIWVQGSRSSERRRLLGLPLGREDGD